MFSHVMVGADDIESAKSFYDATLGAVSYTHLRAHETPEHRVCPVVV